MNTLHNWICGSRLWRAALQRRIVPWALEGVNPGPLLLEIGPGFGGATELLCKRAERVIGLEIDAALAKSLGRRFRSTNLLVTGGDGAALPFVDRTFSSAVCFTMLHHVPSVERQDRLFAEVRRVLRCGGVFVGTDIRWSRVSEWIHKGETLVAIDPEQLAARLQRAGFLHVDVETRWQVLRFRAERSHI